MLKEMYRSEAAEKRATANIGRATALMHMFMKLLAHLSLREMLPLKVQVCVIEGLLHLDHLSPEEMAEIPPPFKIDCVLTWFLEGGHALESDLGKSHRTKVMDGFFSQLSLLSCRRVDGKPFFENRIRSAIEDLLELRKKGWKRGDSGDVLYVEVVGARPEY